MLSIYRFFLKMQFPKQLMTNFINVEVQIRDFNGKVVMKCTW